jgi:hypothetical protein
VSKKVNSVLFSLILLLTIVMVNVTFYYNSSFVFGVFIGSMLLGFLLDKTEEGSKKK